MPDRSFVDTNLFVYAAVDDGSGKCIKALDFLTDIADAAIINTQVVNEFCNALLKYKLPENEIEKRVDDIIETFETRDQSIDDIKLAWSIRSKYSFSYWDSLIIAAALNADCSVLYTEDLQHGQLIDDKLKIVNPFEKQ